MAKRHMESLIGICIEVCFGGDLLLNQIQNGSELLTPNSTRPHLVLDGM
jgi:hypothetical protein